MTGAEPVRDLDAAWALLPGSAQRSALEHAAEALRQRILEGPRAIALRALPTGAPSVVPTPTLVGGLVSWSLPYCLLTHRAVLVQFLRAGVPKILLFLPFLPLLPSLDSLPSYRPVAAPARSKATARLERLAHFTHEKRPGLLEGLAANGLTPDAIDYVSSPRAKESDVPDLTGTFPRARVLAASDLGADREVGDGVLLLQSPRARTQSLVVHAPRTGGIWVASGNGSTVDDWNPLESRMPGVAKASRERDVDLAGTIHDPRDLGDARDEQTASMAVERTLADRLPRAPGFVQVFPLSEITPSVLAPRLRPTVRLSTLDEGPIVSPRRSPVLAEASP